MVLFPHCTLSPEAVCETSLLSSLYTWPRVVPLSSLYTWPRVVPLPSLRIWPREIPFPHYTLGRGSSPSLTAQSAQGGPPVPSPGTTLCHNTSSSCDPGQPTHVALLVLHEDTTHIKMNVHGNHSLEWRACSFICWFLCHVAGE